MLVKESATPRETSTAAHFEFVLSDLDLGATFCEVALNTRNKESKERNIRNAEKAYKTALYLCERLRLGIAEQTRFDEKARHLKGLLERLGLKP